MFGGDHELNVERLSETLQPIVNPYEHVYCAIYRGEHLWAAVRNPIAVAGEFSGAAVVNPADSGLLVVVEGASARPSVTALQAQARLTTEAVIQAAYAASVSTSVLLDRRNLITVARTQTYAGSDPAAITGNMIEEEWLETTDFQPYQCLPVVLPPGQAFVLAFETVNVGGYINFFGTERRALADELKP
jgi:hypothetical protein